MEVLFLSANENHPNRVLCGIPGLIFVGGWIDVLLYLGLYKARENGGPCPLCVGCVLLRFSALLVPATEAEALLTDQGLWP